MASFKDKMKDKKIIGKRVINSDEAIRLAFKDSDKKIFSINIEALSTNPHQPRISMDKEELENLSQSILENGLLQPILVAPIDKNPHKFHIVAGHRRVEATKLLNRTTIDAVIFEMSDIELNVFAIVENLQRENLSAIEEAFAIKSLIDTGMKQADICKKISKSKSVVSNFVRITKLEKDVINFIQINNLTFGATILYELTKVDISKQLESIKYINEKKMNREQVRLYVHNLTVNEENVLPAKPFSGFSLSNKKNKINLKIDLNKLENREEAILAIEEILKELKKV